MFFLFLSCLFHCVLILMIHVSFVIVNRSRSMVSVFDELSSQDMDALGQIDDGADIAGKMFASLEMASMEYFVYHLYI